MAFPGIRIVMRPVPSSFQQLLTLSALRRGDLTNAAIRKCSRQIARPGWITVCTYAKALDVPCPPHCNNLPWDQCVIVSNSDEFPQGRGEEFSTAMRSRIASLEGGPLRYHAEVLLCGRCKHRMSFSSTESDVMSVYPPPGDPPSLEKDRGMSSDCHGISRAAGMIYPAWIEAERCLGSLMRLEMSYGSPLRYTNRPSCCGPSQLGDLPWRVHTPVPRIHERYYERLDGI